MGCGASSTAVPGAFLGSEVVPPEKGSLTNARNGGSGGGSGGGDSAVGAASNDSSAKEPRHRGSSLSQSILCAKNFPALFEAQESKKKRDAVVQVTATLLKFAKTHTHTIIIVREAASQK